MDTGHPQGDGLRTGVCAPDTADHKDSGQSCMVCASQGQTCCQWRDIYVTRGDCERIGHFIAAMDFYEYRGCSQAAYADQDDDPVWRQYVLGRLGRRRVLKRLANGDCLFLGPAGCSLTLTARPLVCRLYPHLYSDKGIKEVWDNECPATQIQESRMIEQGIAGVQLQQAVRWHRMLYTEILWEANTNENRLDL